MELRKYGDVATPVKHKSGTLTKCNSSLTDEILVKMFLDGDERAFTQLYERYRLRVYIRVFQIIRHSEDAHDLTQEIFIKIYRYLDTWNVQRARLSTWIYRLTVNHSLDHLRNRSRRIESLSSRNNTDLILKVYVAENSPNSPFMAIKNREEISLIGRHIEKLPDLQKKTFIGRYIEGLSFVEIAESERCNVGAVKSALHRAKYAVRSTLIKFRTSSLRKMESQA